MAWIESHQELARHPKVRRLARALGITVPAAIGHLHLLWWWALDYADDGDLSEYSADDINDAVMWKCKPGKEDGFWGAALEAGFIDSGPARIHDWETYAGRLLDQRRKDAERKRQSRGRPEVVQRTSGGQAADDRPPSDVTVPNLTVPNRTQPNQTGENGIPSVANATSPRGERRRVTEVDDGFRSELETEYWEAFGSRQAVRDVMDEAMSHKARGKRTDQRAYLRNWVRRDAEAAARRRNGRNGIALIDREDDDPEKPWICCAVASFSNGEHHASTCWSKR